MPQAPPRLRLAAREAVEDRPLGHSLVLEDRERVVPRLSGVDDESQAVAIRQGDLGGEDVALDIARRVVVVVVEPALADGHDAGPAQALAGRQLVEELDHRAQTGLGVVGVQPDCRPDLGGAGACRWRVSRGASRGRSRRKLVRQQHGAARRRLIGPDAHHPPHPHRREPPQRSRQDPGRLADGSGCRSRWPSLRASPRDATGGGRLVARLGPGRLASPHASATPRRRRRSHDPSAGPGARSGRSNRPRCLFRSAPQRVRRGNSGAPFMTVRPPG